MPSPALRGRHLQALACPPARPTALREARPVVVPLRPEAAPTSLRSQLAALKQELARLRA